MTKFLVLYRADASASEQMANATPEEQQAGMQAWMEWFGKAGEAVVDGGAPVMGGEAAAGAPAVCGYSVLQADSRAALDTVLEGHPHTAVGTLEVLEFVPMPGM